MAVWIFNSAALESLLKGTWDPFDLFKERSNVHVKTLTHIWYKLIIKQTSLQWLYVNILFIFGVQKGP